MEKYYTVHVDKYDYFAGASKGKTECFNRIIDAFEFWKSSKAHDFDYGDAYQDTHPIREWWDTNPKKTNVHKGKEIAHKGNETHVTSDVAVFENSNPIWALNPSFDDAELAHLSSLVSEWGDVPFM